MYYRHQDYVQINCGVCNTVIGQYDLPSVVVPTHIREAMEQHANLTGHDRYVKFPAVRLVKVTVKVDVGE